MEKGERVAHLARDVETKKQMILIVVDGFIVMFGVG